MRIKMHDGIDLDGSDGVTSVFAMFGGKVTRVVTGQPNRVNKKYPAGYTGDKNPAGNRITIETTLPNGDKLSTSYFHLDVKANNPYTHSFKVGNIVEAGRVIGVVGYTGNPNRDFPHLHLKMHKNNVSVNPESYLYTQFSPTTGTVTRDCNN